MASSSSSEETGAVDLGTLLDAGEDAMVTLVASETRLVAHTAVLAARSPVFHAMKGHGTLKDEVPIRDVTGLVLRQLLAFLYTLQAPQLPPGMAIELLAAAAKFRVIGLMVACEQQLSAHLSVDTVAAAAAAAVRYGCLRLEEAAIRFIQNHTQQVMATPGWAAAVHPYPEVEVKLLTRLLVEPPAETNTPAGGPTSGAQPQGRTPAAPPPPTPRQRTRPSEDDAASRLPAPASEPTSDVQPQAWTDVTPAPPTPHQRTHPPEEDAASHLCAPAAPAGEPTSGAQPQGRMPAASVPPAPHQRSRPSEEDDASHLRTPSTPAGEPTSGAQPQGRTAATPSPPTPRQRTRPSEDDAASLLWSLPSKEKGKRLMEAANEGTVEDVDALLAAGADVGARDEDRMTALHLAAMVGHVEVARRLQQAGAEVDARDFVERTPLHWAAGYGHAAVVRLLLASSADPNARNDYGETPLHRAVEKGHAEAAAALLQGGADRGAQNNMGRTPLDIARHYNKQPVIDVLTSS